MCRIVRRAQYSGRVRGCQLPFGGSGMVGCAVVVLLCAGCHRNAPDKNQNEMSGEVAANASCGGTICRTNKIVIIAMKVTEIMSVGNSLTKLSISRYESFRIDYESRSWYTSFANLIKRYLSERAGHRSLFLCATLCYTECVRHMHFGGLCKNPPWCKRYLSEHTVSCSLSFCLRTPPQSMNTPGIP